MKYFRPLRPQETMRLGAPFLMTKNAINNEYSAVKPIFYRQKWSTQTHTLLWSKVSEIFHLYRVEGGHFLINPQQETHDFWRNN